MSDSSARNSSRPAATPGRVTGDYTEAGYLQFTAGGLTRFSMAIIGILLWPIALPLALLSRLSDIIFRTFSEMLAMVPYFPGVILRYEFYRFTLRSCGRNVVVESGAVFIYRDVTVGDHVLIGRYSIVHHCDIGDHTLIGERCTFLSGSRQHRFERTDLPMTQQGGEKRRIALVGDCWIGSHAVVMNDVGRGAVVAAGAVVKDPVAEFSIVGGVPAKEIGRRGVAA